ncbi:MAG: sigma-70 family RNA polymerase sigma factor [Cyclobacteriaceae bacterium]
MDHLSDEALIILVQKGDQHFLNEIFRRYERPLFNYFLKVTMNQDDSADLTQTTFIRVMKYVKSFDETRLFKVWLFQIARNQTKDYFRKMKVHKDQFSPVDHLPDLSGDDDSELLIERETKLFKALEKLDCDKRELIVMTKLNGLKYEQVAQIRDTSVGAIKVQVHRTIAQLREIMFNDLTDDE